MYTLNLTNGTDEKTIQFVNPNQGDRMGGTIAKGMMARRMRPGLGRGVMRASQIRGVAAGSQSKASFQQASQQVGQLLSQGYKPKTDSDKNLLQQFFNIKV